MHEGIKVLAFDVFGTVVDWHGTIAREVAARHPQVDGDKFALAWRAGYRPAMQRVMSGELGWTRIDDLHRMILDGLLARFGIRGLAEEEIDHLNRAWHRLRPWPDARAGLAKLKRRHVVATLSNGNVALLVNMAKHAQLPWDCILSAEVVHHYKPDPETYLGAAGLLGVKPAELMMVAAHKDDLHAARACGLKTAYVPRPKEYGPAARPDVSREPAFDVHARDFNDLARQLAR